MGGLEDSLRWYAGELRWLAGARGFIFGWNLFLALVPLGLSLVLFRRGARRSPSWWFGAVVFLLFLPNAAYVLTDVIHLASDVRSGVSDLSLVTVHLPAYGVFFAVGFSAYVLCLVRLQSYLGHVAPTLSWWPVEIGLHAAVSVAIFLGRVVRLNSWDVVRAPGEVGDAMPLLATRFPVLFVAFTFVTLVVLTTIARPTLNAALGWWRRRIGELAGWLAAPGSFGAT